VMLVQAQENIPTQAPPTPEPVFTPTPDLRGIEDIFIQAQQQMRNQDWETVIQTLDVLRKADITYRTIEADGMYYLSLRNRGIDKIVKSGNLEGGIYDLALSERFAPLDRDADGFRTWARMYMAGASFWGIDWPKVIEYFGQIVIALPNLRDGSGYSALERYRIAFIKYGDQLNGLGQYCDAQYNYEMALSIGPDLSIDPKYSEVKQFCEAPQTAPEATSTEGPPPSEPTQKPENPIVMPTDLPTQTPTATFSPTDTPSPDITNPTEVSFTPSP
jgi:hypothetical protein